MRHAKYLNYFDIERLSKLSLTAERHNVSKQRDTSYTDYNEELQWKYQEYASINKYCLHNQKSPIIYF